MALTKVQRAAIDLMVDKPEGYEDYIFEIPVQIAMDRVIEGIVSVVEISEGLPIEIFADTVMKGFDIFKNTAAYQMKAQGFEVEDKDFEKKLDKGIEEFMRASVYRFVYKTVTRCGRYFDNFELGEKDEESDNQSPGDYNHLN